MSIAVKKEIAHKLIDQLSTKDLRETIEEGIEDSRSGRIKSVIELRKKYGLTD